jgi:mannose-6-phosphate isomerase-like protein (cupin superfamily)
MTLRANTTGRILLPVFLLLVLFLVSRSTGYAQRDAQATAAQQPLAAPCPGQAMPSVQATGVYTQKPVQDITINGQPAPGAIWEPGMRSYWHCHAGGQIMMVDEGVGRVQKRGERIRILHKGDTEYAGPGVEHWHGAAPDASAQFFQVSIRPTNVYWMEEVGRDDYMGNDIGITSRNEFLRTGVRKKPEQPPQAPTSPGR